MAEYDIPCAGADCGHARRLHVNAEAATVHTGACSASGCRCSGYETAAPAAQNAASTHCNALPDDPGDPVDLPAPDAVEPPAAPLTREDRLVQLVREAVHIVAGGGEVDARDWLRTATQEVDPMSNDNHSATVTAPPEPLRRQAEPKDCADCGKSTRLWSRLPGSDVYRCPACMRAYLRTLTPPGGASR